MKVIKAPEHYDPRKLQMPVIFLAGSIEMGKAVNWQTKTEQAFEDVSGTILNPRRDDWDSSWEQKIENDQFRTQVEWELDSLSIANIILMHFEPGTQSPITLLELGLFASKCEQLIVHCPEGFWRKGNVDIVCKRYGIDQVNTMEEAYKIIKKQWEWI